MRKLLLRLANNIYKKYSYTQIKIDEKLVYKNDIFTIVEIKTKDNAEMKKEMNIKLYYKQTLQSYINEKTRKC